MGNSMVICTQHTRFFKTILFVCLYVCMHVMITYRPFLSFSLPVLMIFDSVKHCLSTITSFLRQLWLSKCLNCRTLNWMHISSTQASVLIFQHAFANDIHQYVLCNNIHVMFYCFSIGFGVILSRCRRHHDAFSIILFPNSLVKAKKHVKQNSIEIAEKNGQEINKLQRQKMKH